jgi:hypothetical protein
MRSRQFQHDLSRYAGIKGHGRLRIMGWLNHAVLVCLAISVSLCAYLAFAQAAADRHSRQQTPEGIRRAIWWEPWNPDHYSQLARALERPLKAGDRPEVVRLYEKAVQLSPHNAEYWDRLGQAYEWAGRVEAAQDAHERAALLFPASPTMNWTIGNFYLREGKTEPALHAFKRAILGDPEMRRPAFDLAWRATGDGELIVHEMIPAQADICFEYLNYLLDAERLDEGTKVWDQIIDTGLHFEPRQAFPYLDALILYRRIDQLTAAWSALKEKNPSMFRDGTSHSNLITNGDFESEILNGGLDWRINQEPGAVISIDNLTFRDGIHSLQIRFEGNQNLSDALIFQYVPVTPNTSYRFEGYLRAQGITTDSGPRFQIRDAGDPAELFLQTDDVVGNSSWVQRQVDFKSGPSTRLLELRVARPPSAKFDNRIAGTVWVDQVVMTAIESAASTHLARSMTHEAEAREIVGGSPSRK